MFPRATRSHGREAGLDSLAGDGYPRDLRAAQVQIVLTLANTRRRSPALGDYLWFVVPVYIAQDFVVTDGKLIPNPGGAAFGLKPLRVIGREAVECGLRPWLTRALAVAWEKGYLKDSRDPADYRVAHLNLGWEVPGLDRVAMELRGLSLRAARPLPAVGRRP